MKASWSSASALPPDLEVSREIRVGDRPQLDRRGQARRMDVLFQHVPDLAGVAAVIKALVLVDDLRRDLEESRRPFDLGGELQDRRIGR